MTEPRCTATGYAAEYLPDGSATAEVMDLLRLGLRFRSQQVGRRPGFLHRYIAEIVASIERPTFEKLLAQLDLAAARRNASDNIAREPIERVSRSFQILTYHDPRAGRQQVTFCTLRNHMSTAKNKKFPTTPNP